MRPTLEKPQITLHQASAQHTLVAPRLARPALRAVPPKVLHIEPHVTQPVAQSCEGNRPNPYVEYSRTLTAEGGILLTFKAIDDAFLLKLRRFFLWACSTCFEIWFAMHFLPGTAMFAKVLCLLVASFVNWRIVKKPVEIMRSIEIRPDCLVFDGRDLFRRQYFENKLPSFELDHSNAYVLSGTYGTRHVEFLSLRRFDENDRAPEVLRMHFADALMQLWRHAL